MKIESELIEIPQLCDGKPFFAIEAIHDSMKSEWLVLKGSGELKLVDFGDRSVASIAMLGEIAFDRTKETVMHVSGDGRFVAVANRHGTDGAVVDLSTGQTTMILKRDSYHVEQSSFPLAFVKRADRWLLVHGTEWNRLDVSDPLTGELLTARESPKYEQERPAHYLDYFHATLVPSPDHTWIADTGWAWQPVGVIRTWSVDRWLEENVWESEDGPTAIDFCLQDCWDQPMCWIDERTVAAWAEVYDTGKDQPVLGFFDVESGKGIRTFEVPYGRMFVDSGRLVVPKSIWNGITVWDIATGSQLLDDGTVYAVKYHRGAKQFWGLVSGRTHMLSRLSDDC